MTVTPEFPQDDDDEARRREAAGMPKDISDMSAAERNIFDGLVAGGWETPPQPRDFINPEITLSLGGENGKEVFLREHLPEVFAQIEQAIPNDPRDLRIIFDALENFAPTIDKSRVEAHMTWDDFQDFIGEYISQRINLGTVEYILDVEGLVSTRTMDHEVIQFTHEEPYEYRVKIGKIFLDITPGTDSDPATVTCRPVLETFHRLPGWNGGYVPYFIPIGSVLRCRSTRPARLPFATDGSVLDSDGQMEDEELTHPVDGDVFDSLAVVHDGDIERGVGVVDTIAPSGLEEGMATIAEITGEHSRQEYLEAMEKQLSDLWKKVCQLSAVEYETQEGGIAARERVKELILKFHTAYYANEFELSASGSGVMLPNISTSYSHDQKTVKVELTMHGQTTFEPGNVTTEIRGFLEDSISLDVVEMPDNKFMIRVQLTLAGLVDEPLPTIYNAENYQPLVELSQKRYYNVEIRPDTTISIVELDYRRDQEAAIAELVTLFPERSEIPPAMGVLMYELSADKEDEYEAIESTPNINELAELAVEYPEHADAICSALQRLFGYRHKLIMNGPVIYHDGEKGEDLVRGELVGIVPEYRYKLTTGQEPFAVLLLAKTATQTHDRLVYVPLQSVRIIEA